MSVRLRPVLLVGLLVLQAITVVAVVASTGRNTEGMLVDAMGRTMMLAVETLDQRTSEHLAPAEDAAQLGAELIVDGVLPIDDDATLLRYLDSQVLSNLSITGAYVGRPDGSFVLVSRDGATVSGGTRVKTITVDPDRRSVTAQRDADGVVRSEDEDPDDPFDPRARPWYEAAVAERGTAWTDPYIFFASREPGITSAFAARDADGEIVAVVGVDLSLRDLSTFVGRMEVGDGSSSILVDETGFMVAAADIDQVNVDDGEGGLRRANVDEVTDPVVTAGVTAARTVLAAEPSRAGTLVVPFEVDGRRWQIALAPLDARPTWLAAVVAPEDQFVTNVVDAQRENALLAVAIGLAVTVLAAPAVLAVSRRVDRLAEQAVTDPVTGLANRRRFDEMLVDQLAKASPSHPVCVALVDVDLFKPVNDTWGHNVGDQVLAVIAARLRGELRDRDLVARIGGDEFAVILIDTEFDAAWHVLDRTRQAVGDRPASTDKAEIDLSITIGVAESVGLEGDDRSSVMERADRALYGAKKAGRNRVAGPDLRQVAVDSEDVTEPAAVIDP
ncbi:MAG: sensor domain-containing diguanylate cyclase [Acidimicrobiales bacterium]